MKRIQISKFSLAISIHIIGKFFFIKIFYENDNYYSTIFIL